MPSCLATLHYMRLYYLMTLLLTLQAGDCIQFLLQGLGLRCIANFIDQETISAQRSAQVVIPRCTSFYPKFGTGLDYDFTKGLIYFNDVNTYNTPLIGLTYNFNWKIRLPNENTSVSNRPIAINWVNSTYYALNFKGHVIMSTTVPSNNQFTDYVVTRGNIAELLGLDERIVDVMNVHVDPYEEFLFLLVVIRLNHKLVLLRSNLKGHGLKSIGTFPYTNTRFSICLDVGEKTVYHAYNDTLYRYNYEGTLLKEFILPYLIAKYYVLGNHVYITSKTSEDIYEFLLGEKESMVGIKNIYRINTTNSIVKGTQFILLKLLDARVQRRKRDGKYVCERQDCSEQCEVLPTGDTCFCNKDKAKARDGEMCYKCGQSKLTSLEVHPTIVGGNYTQVGEFPWYAAIFYTNNKEQVCGGTLVSSRAVLTAAHCVTTECMNCIPSKLQTKDIMVSFGRTQRAWDIEEGYRIMWQVTEIHVHEKYVGHSLNHAYDIALLLLCCSVPVANLVMPACLDFNLNQLPPHETLDGYVPGFGYTEECGGNTCSTSSEKLKHTKVRVITFLNCLNSSNTIYPSSFHRLTPDKFCIGNGLVSPIQKGDSGGGLTLECRGLHYVTGVVSVKLTNDRKKKYSFGAFTNVSDHMDWLKNKLPQDD